MLAVIPESWKSGPIGGVRIHQRADGCEAVDEIRSALSQGEKLFLLGTEGVSSENCFLVATDHVSLFGGSPLIGANRDDLGPRFPSLMDLYLSPEGQWSRGVVGNVPDWRLATPAEMRVLGVSALVSTGVSEAEVAGHGGGKVALLVRCHGWNSMNGNYVPLEEVAEAAMSMFVKRFT